jgi:RND family efflux transporter MFP subunit
MSDRLSSDLASLRIDRDAAPPRGARMRILVITGVVIAAVALGAVFLVPYITSKVFKTEIAVTEISLLSPAQSQVLFTSTGYVEPETISQVAAKVAGRVVDVKVKIGKEVKKGDVLLEIDRINQMSAIRTTRARVAAAHAAAQTARAQVIEAENQARLAKRMAEQGVGAQAQSVDAEARVNSLRAAVKAADAQMRAIQQEVAALEVDLDNYTVLAPFDGTVVNEPPEVGDVVGPSFGGVASQLGSIEMVDFNSLLVNTDVPEARLHMVEVGKPCEVILDAFPDNRHRCRVKEILPRVNRAKATVSVRVSFTDKVPRALPDMAARVSFLSAELDAAAMKEPPKKVVAKSAVLKRDGASVIFVVEDERVRMVPVKLGGEMGDGFVLTDGPDPGTKVVANPPDDLSDGQKIKEKGDQ